MPACPALQATGASPYVPFAAGWGGQRHPQKNCLLSCAGDEPETMGPPAVTEVRTGEVDGLRLVATPGEPLRLPPTVVDTSCHGLEAGGPLTQRPAVGARLRGSVEFRGGDAVFPLRGAGDGQAPAGSAWPRPRPRGAVVGSCAVVATANARPCAWPGPATANAPQAATQSCGCLHWGAPRGVPARGVAVGWGVTALGVAALGGEEPPLL
mmetsp:Transcript_99693/g.311332  ORF Transcript_99693/g.311332 Transcript_99693/m.311332 type:complete len:210 (-) Transcript_99693:764-1393(-)